MRSKGVRNLRKGHHNAKIIIVLIFSIVEHIIRLKIEILSSESSYRLSGRFNNRRVPAVYVEGVNNKRHLFRCFFFTKEKKDGFLG